MVIIVNEYIRRRRSSRHPRWKVNWDGLIRLSVSVIAPSQALSQSRRARDSPRESHATHQCHHLFIQDERRMPGGSAADFADLRTFRDFRVVCSSFTDAAGAALATVALGRYRCSSSTGDASGGGSTCCWSLWKKSQRLLASLLFW